ncbi:putative extracellular nuclease [Saonia flava]|uniref:Putative extracellular nuclease n=1 Tax=Saonia flava TaxID=523696 RepID=A0A846R0Z2_9FLAO|nr:endonuclease [Saonia flava]NJB71605.1 putative extracellular nuclease [Saonia flava]
MFKSFFKKKKDKKLFTIAFYNVENLFDTTNDFYKLDDDFTPNGFKNWTPKRYRKKLIKLGKVISQIGHTENSKPPVLIGLAEIENGKVVKDLISVDTLKEIDYDYVHYESPDERGIDTGLIYNTKYFELIQSETLTVWINNPNGERDTTRDILYVNGKLNKEEVHIFVNHWPSRRDGEIETGYKRVQAAETLLEKMAIIEKTHENPNYIVMGDFNDGPNSESINTLLEDGTLYNPMKQLLSPVRGSANYKRKWSLFDQILFSHTFFNYEKETHSFAHANIFDEHFLKEWKGKYKGNPYRTYVGRKYVGGYSDHFPVYIQLKFNV